MTSISIKEFFASANTYFGFKSYFNEVFDSFKLTRAFVLKGGPGTGKSTLMKKVGEIFKREDLSMELFRCSSDCNSLDGLVLRNDNESVAIIDGTAPHVRDAVIPGAVDVLINLGEAIDNNVLTEAKNDVLKLNKAKSNSYQNAYDKLAKSFIFYSNIKAEMQTLMNFELMKKSFDDVLKTLECEKNTTRALRLISSFSKEGYRRLNHFDTSSLKRYTVSGESGSEFIFLTLLAKHLDNSGVKYTKIISALDKESVEGIYFSDLDTVILGGKENNCICDTREFFSKKYTDSFKEKIKNMQACMQIYEKEAADELKAASVSHFELEKIYTDAVDFSIIDRYTSYIIDEISKIFI